MAMTKDELRRLHSYLGIQLMDENLTREERKEITGLKWIVNRELNMKLLERNPNIHHVREWRMKAERNET